MSDRFKEGSTGHDIIDSVVVKNQGRNMDVFMSAQDYPPYFGAVNVGEHKLKLSPIRGRNKLGKQLLIQDIVEGVKNFKLDAGEAKVSLVKDGVISESVVVHPVLIKLIKTCVASSYNPNEDYSLVVSEFVNTLLTNVGNLNLPLQLPENNKTQKIVALELNNYLKDLCNENDIPYHVIIESKQVKKKRHPLIEAAEKGKVCVK